MQIEINSKACDPMGDGESLAVAIREGARDEGGSAERAVQIILVAALDLGAKFVVVDGPSDDDLRQTMIELDDETLARLKNAIARAEAFVRDLPRNSQRLL